MLESMTPLLLGLGSLALLLFMILKLRLHPFLSLTIVATLLAAAGVGSVEAALKMVEGGVGKTLGHVALLVALGAMIGRMVDQSGGARALADALAARFGTDRIPLALCATAFILGIPVFFEVGVIMLMPVIYGVSRRTGRPPAVYAVPVCAILLLVHSLLPPHPGAVAVAGILGIDLGRMVLFGLPIAAVTAMLMFPVTRVIMRRPVGVLPEVAEQIEQGGHLPEGHGVSAIQRSSALDEVPVSLIVCVIALPIILILGGMLAGALLPAGSVVAYVIGLLGVPYIALLIDVLLCAWLLGIRRGQPMSVVSDTLASALPPTAMVILVTGAGGGLAQILVGTGVGAALSGALQGTGLPVLALAFAATLALRVLQGPTTVALMATAGILQPLVATMDLSPNRLALLALAMGAGGMCLSHVNDGGFWFVTRLSGLTTREGLTRWTPATAAGGGIAFLLIALLWQVVP